jgi:hypothetical protein
VDSFRTEVFGRNNSNLRFFRRNVVRLLSMPAARSGERSSERMTMPLTLMPASSTSTARLIFPLQPPKTPFALLCQLSFVYVAGSALHVPWQTAAIIAGFILAAYLIALATSRSNKQAKR